ncbi:MAG: restriction endonuclease subunit S [Saprospiraceae bacterium]
MREYNAYLKIFGEIPNSWKYKKLKTLARITLGKMLQPKNSGNDYLKPYLRAFNIVWEKVDVSDVKKMWFSSNEIQNYRLNFNDILVTEGGDVGRTSIWKNELKECYIQNSVHKVTCSKKILPTYLLYQMLLLGKAGYFDSIVNRVSIAHLTKEKLSNIKVLLPTILEQKSIVTYLNTRTNQIDKLITNKKAQIAQLKTIRQITINEAITKGLDTSVRMQDSGVDWLGEIPEHWELKRFKNITSLKQGLQIAQEDRFLGEVPNCLIYITIKYLNSKPENRLEEYIQNPDAGVVCNEDDVLLARTGATGQVVTNVKGVFHNNFFKIRYRKDKIIKDYLVHYLKDKKVKEHLLLLAGTTTIPDLNHGAFYSCRIPLPDLEEQREIVNYLDKKTIQIDQAINNLNTQIEQLHDMRKIEIYNAVTGKIKIV